MESLPYDPSPLFGRKVGALDSVETFWPPPFPSTRAPSESRQKSELQLEGSSQSQSRMGATWGGPWNRGSHWNQKGVKGGQSLAVFEVFSISVSKHWPTLWCQRRAM